METLERVLAEHPFFHDVPSARLQRFVGCAMNVKWDAGKVIFREGEPAEHLYLIRYGRVAVELAKTGGAPIVIETLDPGDVLGWSWLLPPYQWHFEARALGLVRAIALDGKCLREKSETDHEFGYVLMKRMAELIARRLVHTSMQLLDVYGKA